VEDDRGSIEDYMHRYGYGPKEAEAVYRLKQARNLFEEIYKADAAAAGTGGFPQIYAEIHLTGKVRPHFDALEHLIEKRSLDRQYPEGWGRRRQEGEGPE